MSLPSSPSPRSPGRSTIPKTRASSAWVGLSSGMILLVAVLIFILQNLHSTTVHFVNASWRIPLGVDLLFAVILGGLIVFCAGSLRILQLRRLARRQSRLIAHSGPRDVDLTVDGPDARTAGADAGVEQAAAGDGLR